MKTNVGVDWVVFVEGHGWGTVREIVGNDAVVELENGEMVHCTNANESEHE